MEREALVLEMAAEAGFDLAGLAPAQPPAAGARFEAWLDAGRHGGMAWLERDRERILHPERLLPGGRTLLVVGLGHARPEHRLPDGARVARYAVGRDYHNVLGKRLGKLARRLAAEGLVERTRTVVDAGPLMERSHGAQAGLGFESKAANLLHPAFGPWFFLGELLLDVELCPTSPPTLPECGTCTACLDACPTGALVAPGLLDARTCISYLTIEHRGPIPPELRPALGDWAFGCDVCSEVCPWGKGAPDLSERFGVHSALADAGLVSWVETSPESFPQRFRGSPLQRARREGLARNAAIVLGNRPSDAGHRALLRALTFDPSAVVREAVAWGLARGYREEARTREALDRARVGDPNPSVRRGVERNLERVPGVDPDGQSRPAR